MAPEVVKTVTLWNVTLNRKVVRVRVGELHTFMATSDGQLFAVGDNNETNLGVGSRGEVVVHPRAVLMPETSKNTLLSSSFGDIPSSPRSLASSSSPLTAAAPISIPNATSSPPSPPPSANAASPALDISTLGRHSLAISEQGRVFSWGACGHGQLGHGLTESVQVPRLILSLDGIKIVQVACGWSHSLCLSEDGRVFAFGDGEDGKLGLGNTLDFVVPFTVNHFINKNIKIAKIAAGHFHSAAIDEKGRLFTWGANTCGVLGLGHTERSLLPTQVTNWQRLNHNNTTGARGVALGAENLSSSVPRFGSSIPQSKLHQQPISSSVATSSTQDNAKEGLKTPSKNSRGRIETPSSPGDFKSDSKTLSPDSSDSGNSFNLNSMVITPPATPSKRAKQDAYSPAIASAYQIRDLSIEWKEGDEVVSVACGAFHMMVATRDGSCFTWGKGDSCALGLGTSTHDVYLPTQVQALRNWHISKVSCGMYHSMALADLDPLDDPTSSINLSRPGILSSTPTYDSKMHFPREISTPNGSSFDRDSSTMARASPHSVNINSEGEAFKMAITNQILNYTHEGPNSAVLDETKKNTPRGSGELQSAPKGTNSQHHVIAQSAKIGTGSGGLSADSTRPEGRGRASSHSIVAQPSSSLHDDSENSEIDIPPTPMTQFARAAAEVRVLGISTTASAFEKAIYGVDPQAKLAARGASSSSSQDYSNTSGGGSGRGSGDVRNGGTAAEGANVATAGGGSIRFSAAFSAAQSNGSPSKLPLGSDSNPNSSTLTPSGAPGSTGGDAAPTSSKPMEISPHQRRHTVGFRGNQRIAMEEDDFPSIAATWRNTVVDTEEYSLAIGRVKPEVARLRYMLDSSVGSSRDEFTPSETSTLGAHRRKGRGDDSSSDVSKAGGPKEADSKNSGNDSKISVSGRKNSTRRNRGDSKSPRSEGDHSDGEGDGDVIHDSDGSSSDSSLSESDIENSVEQFEDSDEEEFDDSGLSSSKNTSNTSQGGFGRFDSPIRPRSISQSGTSDSLPSRADSFTLFPQDQTSTASSPNNFIAGSSTSLAITEDNNDVTQLSPTPKRQFKTAKPSRMATVSPVKFGFTTRTPEAPQTETLSEADFEQVPASSSSTSPAARTSENKTSSGAKKSRVGDMADSSSSEGGKGKTKKGKSKRRGASESSSTSGNGGGGRGATRFGQLVEDFFRKRGEERGARREPYWNSRSSRLDRSQEEMERQTEKMDSLSDIWLTKIIPQWEVERKKKSVKNYWRRGIPANIRGIVWGFLIKDEISLDFNIYEAAMKTSKLRYQLWIAGNANSNTSGAKNGDNVSKNRNGSSIFNERIGQSPFHVIDVDVPRTHPETKLFKAGGPFHGDLVNLLHVYAAFDSEMSYVQGMSYLAAFFVTHCPDPFTAFRCFANLLNTHFFRNLFKMNLTQILRHMSAYELLFERTLPQLFSHFTDLCITPEQYLLDWFMTCFSRAFSLQIASRIFDCLIIEGEIFLYRTALAILKLSEKQLLLADFEHLLPMFRSIARELDEETLFATIKSIRVPKEVRVFIRKIKEDPGN